MVEISLVDPLGMLGIVTNPAVEPVAREARERLERVVRSLQSN